MPRCAECASAPGGAGAHPLRGQPIEHARTVERECIGGRMSAVPVRQALQSTRDANERVVRFNARASVGDAQLSIVLFAVVLVLAAGAIVLRTVNPSSSQPLGVIPTVAATPGAPATAPQLATAAPTPE